ncbi:MAG: glycoside hydrolase family 113 [Planctomycetota bacterium]|jgi:hypothetical protein
MSRWTAAILSAALLVILPVWGPGAIASGAGRRGMSLTLWNQTVNLAQLGQSLDNLAGMGVDHVAVNVWWFQDDIYSKSIAPDFTRYSASDDSVRAAIDQIHAHGMKAMLKPLVDLSDDPFHWRGQIVGGSDWFGGTKGYGDFINHFADLAEDKGVDLFCVGTELVATVAQEADWRSLIAGVRSRYSGELTYAANHGGAFGVTAAAINWWDELDYFGLDAYYPLTHKFDPTLVELQDAWAMQADEIEAWRSGIDPSKSVLFTEVGYRSWDGANRAPYDGSYKGDTNVDEAEQAECYEALFSELWEKRDWLEGLYLWNWEVDPDPTWEADNWYTPQGKPAEAVLDKYYDPIPGDANYDGKVGIADLGALADSYGLTTGANWMKGDFNLDGQVGIADLAALADNYGKSSGGVPEPATLALLAIVGAALIRRR